MAASFCFAAARMAGSPGLRAAAVLVATGCLVAMRNPSDVAAVGRAGSVLGPAAFVIGALLVSTSLAVDLRGGLRDLLVGRCELADHVRAHVLVGVLGAGGVVALGLLGLAVADGTGGVAASSVALGFVGLLALACVGAFVSASAALAGASPATTFGIALVGVLVALFALPAELSVAAVASTSSSTIGLRVGAGVLGAGLTAISGLLAGSIGRRMRP